MKEKMNSRGIAINYLLEEMMQYDEGVHFAIASATHNHFIEILSKLL